MTHITGVLSKIADKSTLSSSKGLEKNVMRSNKEVQSIHNMVPHTR